MPRSGGPAAVWGPKIKFDALTIWDAYAIPTAGTGGTGNITSSFFLLVKYAEVTTKSFICKGDSGVTEWEPPDKTRDVISYWDFGGTPSAQCSYSLHQPFCTKDGFGFPLTTSSDPGMAVAADPSPWCDSDASGIRDFAAFLPNGGKDARNQGNSITHQDEGQNVLFLDSHVSFENTSACGINDDNIYTQATTTDIMKGVKPTTNAGMPPMTRQDNLLVNDFGTGGGNKSRSCFTAETPVWINGKMVEIAKVASSASIKGVQEHAAGMNACYEMTLESGNSITIVHSHYFMTADGEWKKIEELSAGMELQTMNGTIAIKSVVKKTMPFVGGSYNLMLNDSEQYYVGQDGVTALDCSKTTWEILESARQ